MNRVLPGLAVAILVGVPLALHPSWGVGLMAGAGGLLAAAGLLRLSLAGTTAGGVLALMALALALWQAPEPGGWLLPALFGLALLVAVEGAHLQARYRRAVVADALRRRWLAWSTTRAVGALALAWAVALLAPLVALQVPSWWLPLAAGLGALVAFAAAVALAWPGTDD